LPLLYFGEKTMNTVISTTKAPAAVGPYNQAIKAGNTVYCSGQIGLDPATGTMVEGVIAQANRAFVNLEAVLTQAGAKMTDVVKFTIFLTDINDFAQVNEVMASHVPTPYPARSCMQVAALPKGALVEVEAIAVI
jgi:2-iminobutanoate/2-iminopropanoate deaminase